LLTLKSFRSLNTAKYGVILDLEKNLPIKLFGDEWRKLGEGKDKKVYLKLSVVEQGVPLIFILLYWTILNIMILF